MFHAQYKKSGRSKPHTSKMNPVIVLCLCIAVQLSSGQLFASDMLDRAELPSLSPAQNDELMIQVEPEVIKQEPEESSPESLPAKPNPEETPTASAPCEGDQCEKALLHEEKPITNPIKEQTAVQSPSEVPSVTSVWNAGSSENKWIADIFQLFRKFSSMPTIPNVLDTQAKTDFYDSIKEYMRSVDEGSLAIKHNLVDVLDIITTLLGSPVANFIN